MEPLILVLCVSQSEGSEAVSLMGLVRVEFEELRCPLLNVP